jgi:hypothetical protein
VQGTATTGNQTSGITVETSGEIGKIQNEATQQLEQGNSENSTEETGNRENAEGEKGTSTGFTKSGSGI